MPKVDPTNIRDYGLVAYLMTQKVECIRNKDNLSYSVSQVDENFTVLVKRYLREYKPVLDKIRSIKKKISTPKS